MMGETRHDEAYAGDRRNTAPVLLFDEPAADSLERIVSSAECEVLRIRPHGDVVAEVSDREIAVALIDLGARGADGPADLATVERLAAARRDVPIVVVGSDDADRSLALRAYAAGAVDFIARPVEPDVLRAKIAAFAALCRARRQSALERRSADERLSASEGRLQALASLALDLSTTRTRAQVAAVIVEQGARSAGADICTLYMLDASGASLELVGHRGVAPEVLAQIQRLIDSPDNPTFATMKHGVAQWVESERDYAARFPQLAATKSESSRARAFWSIPLVVEGAPVGLLGMGYYQARTFSPGERSFVETFGKQCAQALVRAVRLEREQEARRRLVITLRSIGDGVIATDPSGVVTFMNPVAEQLTGWTEAEAAGRPLDEVFLIFSERDSARVESPVTKVLREGAVVGLANHTLLRSRYGRELPIADSGAPISDEDGRLFGVVLVFRDATIERRDRARREFLARAGETLASSLDHRQTLAAVARLVVPELADWCTVYILEPGSRAPQQIAVAHADPAKVELARQLALRYPPDPDAPRGPFNVIRTGEAELYPELSDALLEASARDAEQLRVTRELRLESAMVVPLRSGSRVFGAMTFIYAGSGRRYSQEDLAFAEDFARRAAMAIENAHALRAAEESRARERVLRAEAELVSRAKDEFLATVSHELRTPLNSILGWTVTLRNRRPPPEIDRGLAIIERNARLQAKLVEDVLDISRIISGKLSLNLGPTNVADAVAAAIETVAPAAEAKEVTVCAETAGANVLITADADRIQQVIWNLLSNAVKFTPKGGRVAVRAYRDGADVCVSISDTGEGIPPDVLPLVFEPFQQADASTARRHGGLGLGLAIVKQLVVAHGGCVRAHSDGIGKGATFVVELPARSPTPAIVRSARSAASADAARLGSRSLPRLDGLRLLVVDDDDDARTLLGEVLCELGADVELAASADEALKNLDRLRPDVIVSDISMPVTDGYALIRQIRGLPAARGGRTPAVALTAYARAEDAQRAFAAGFQRHITKPVDPAQLANVVANLGGRSLT